MGCARAPRGAAHRLRHAPHRAVQDPPAGARGVRVGLACRVDVVGPGPGDDDGRGDEEEEGGERDCSGRGTGRGHGFLAV